MAGTRARPGSLWWQDVKRVGDRTVANASTLERYVKRVGVSRDENGGNTGGYHIGPFGQWLGGPAFRPFYWGYRYRGAYAYGPRYRYRRYWRY